VRAQTGTDRVRNDVPADSGELLLVLDLAAPESFAEKVAPAAVACVEPLGVPAVQLLEPGRELRDGRLYDEVVVVRHQAERVQAPVVLADDEAEESQEDPAVVVVPVDGDPSGTARGDVEPAVGEDVSRQPCHASKLERAACQSIVCGRTVTLLAHKPRPFPTCQGTVPSHGRGGEGCSGPGRGQSPDMGSWGTADDGMAGAGMAGRFRSV